VSSIPADRLTLTGYRESLLPSTTHPSVCLGRPAVSDRRTARGAHRCTRKCPQLLQVQDALSAFKTAECRPDWRDTRGM